MTTNEHDSSARIEPTPTILEILPGSALPEASGGKARGLELIARAGLRIPPAWIVLPEASGRDLIVFDERLRQAVSGSFAVRSSARGEDEEMHSFAGIHDSRLAVAAEDLPGVIPEIAASALSERALAYRKHLGLAPPDGPCAVVVQVMVPGECSGIAFGVGDSNDQVVIEAVEGLGELAVQGRATPESIDMRRSSNVWTIDRRRHRLQAFALKVTESGPSLVPVPAEQQSSELLTIASATEVAEGVTILQQISSHRLDVEWTVHDGRVFFLQARPQSRPVDRDIPPGQVWSRINMREVLPGIPSALTRSVIGKVLNSAQHEFLRMHGLRVDEKTEIVTFVYGRPVFNEAGYALGDTLGASRQEMQANLGGSDEPGDEFIPLDYRRALRHPLVLARALKVALSAEGRANKFIERRRALRHNTSPLEVVDASDEELLETIRSGWTTDAHESLLLILGVVSALAGAQSDALAVLRRCPAPRSLVTRLVAVGEGSVSTQQLEDLISIAIAARRWPGAFRFFDRTTPDHASIAYWENQLPPVVWEMVRTWIERYGHRGPCESEISSPRYLDDLRPLARALAPLVAAEATPESPDESRERRAREAEQAWIEVARHVSPWGRWRARLSLRRVKRLMALRELLRSEAVAHGYPVRSMVLEVGRRLMTRGSLQRGEDVWHLSLDELNTALLNPEFDAEIAVRRELSRIAAWRHIEVPNRFTSEEVSGLVRAPLAEVRLSEQLSGDGISPGISEARVCVLRSPEAGERLEYGAILVAPATDPGWSPLFARAVGIVVELGGLLSHSGIVAREYGIPCVSNVEGATRKLKDGDLIRLDGSHGLITVISRASETKAVPIDR